MDAPKLRVLLVITPRRFSGAEHVAVWQAQGLRERGHEVLVLTRPNALLEAELARWEIPCRVAGISGKANPGVILRIARVAREFRADVIHTHLSGASLWGSFSGRLLGVPVVAQVHALNTKTCFVYATRIVTCSAGVREHLLAQGVRAERVEVLYNGLPAARFADLRPAAELRQELGLAEGQPVIGCVAHLSPKKGQRHLLEAMVKLRAQFPDLVCLLLGDTTGGEDVLALAETLGLGEGIRFLGFRADAVALMQLMEVVVLPSVAKEGLGLALVEAAFLGKPTVGSDCPGISEAIADGETGLLVPPGDSAALAAALAHLLGDAELRARLGAAGRRRAQALFSQTAMAARAEEIYRAVIARQRRQPAS